MFRSPQPGVQRVEKKVVEDTEKNDLIKFLGTSLSTFDDESSARVASSFSKRSASVPFLGK